MRKSLLMAALLILPATPICIYGQSTTPQVTAVEPASGLAGAVLTVSGANLDQNIVAAVYLTDGKTDIKTAIVEQTANSIKFRIPADIKPGRLAVMFLTKGKEPKFIEEPFKVTIEPATPTS